MLRARANGAAYLSSQAGRGDLIRGRSQMAKCVRHNGEVKRVSNEEAARIVKAGGRYVAKSEWKRRQSQ